MVNTDPGLQPERTALAWQRTAVAFFANAAVFARTGLALSDSFIAWMAFAGLMACAVTAACGLSRGERFRQEVSNGVGVAAFTTLFVSVASGSMCLTGLYLVVRSI
jgi:uncharacterized membrane protein YidH (DUF202 family)